MALVKDRLLGCESEMGICTTTQRTQDQTPPKRQHPRARNDYDEEAAYVSYMNPEPGFQWYGLVVTHPAVDTCGRL